MKNQKLPIVTVHLSAMRFFAFHGLYDEEKKNGNQFELNLKLSFRQTKAVIKGIKDTIDYAKVFGVVQQEMQKPRELLETLAAEIIQQLKATFPQSTRIEIQINKIAAPIRGFNGVAGISLLREFEEE